MNKSKIEQLKDFVKIKFNIDIDITTFKRTYAGYHQRCNGGWSWTVNYLEYAGSLGSSWSITELLKNKDYIIIQDDELILDL